MTLTDTEVKKIEKRMRRRQARSEVRIVMSTHLLRKRGENGSVWKLTPRLVYKKSVLDSVLCKKKGDPR